VRSLDKVFGKKPERALSPEYAGKSQADILAEIGCVIALQDVTFDVAYGETFVVMGLSGSGKSTLVRCLIRLIEPTSGQISINGEDICRYDEKQLIQLRRGKVAMVFQHYGLLPHRKVIDNVAWGLEVRGIPKQERYATTREVIELVGLTGWENAYPYELSGGMQQRVGLARALAVDPDIMLLDEPFSGLDPLIRRNMQEELLRLQQQLHKTIVFITHDLNEALKIGDRIAIMREGRIVQIGSPEDIILSPADDYVSDFTRDVRRESILTAAIVMEKSRAVILQHQTPDAAVKTMNRNNVNYCSVVDSSTIHLGIVSLERAQAAANQGYDSVGENLDADAATVTMNTPFEELIPLSLACEHPLCVVDDQGKLVGEISRAAVAAKLNEGGSEESSAGDGGTGA
jgi:glycine betaine/proline transport system ATP-binding protein